MEEELRKNCEEANSKLGPDMESRFKKKPKPLSKQQIQLDKLEKIKGNLTDYLNTEIEATLYNDIHPITILHCKCLQIKEMIPKKYDGIDCCKRCIRCIFEKSVNA